MDRFGCDELIICRFWNRRAGFIGSKLFACIRTKRGGCLEQTIRLNDTWGKIEQRFKLHGHELW